MTKRTGSSALIMLALLTAGCDMFDRRLYEATHASSAIADTCDESGLPTLKSSSDFVPIDLGPLDDSWQVANCSQGRAPGNDGFFAVDMRAHQKFHFHVNAIDAVDPIVYVVDSCDERACQPLDAASACPGSKEHLSFIAPRAGRYFVGIDGADPGGGRVELLAISPICGDGKKEHSEACDDGNLKTGDGCDASCRIEIAESGRTAQEPNDDFTVANVLELATGPQTFTIHGTLEGPCDPDAFTFQVPTAMRATLRVLDAEGKACSASKLASTLHAQLYEGTSLIAEGATSGANPCPVVAAQPLQAAADTRALPWADGTYHVVLTANGPADSAPIDYTLQLVLEAPARK